jgi:hypothetical protein
MPDEPRKIPLGKPLELTDEQLEELAQVSPADIEKAKALWRAHAPEEFRDLLDAETVEDEE